MSMSRWVDVHGARVHYLVAGEGARHVVLLHGSGADSARLSYSLLLPALARHFTVVAPDFPGYGDSERTPAADSTAGLVDFVVSFLDALGIDRADVAGLSMGGGVALGLTVHHPGRVRRAVLMAPHGLARRSLAGFSSLVLTRLPAAVYAWSWRYASSRPERTRRTMRRVWGNQVLLTDDLLDDVRHALGRADAWKVVRNWARGESRWLGYRTCYVDHLQHIEQPILLVHGEMDRLVPIAGSRVAATRMRDARLVVLPACGHWIPRECPDALIGAVHEFLTLDTEVTP